MANGLDWCSGDITKELEIVRQIIVEHGQPELTEEALREVAAKQAAPFAVGDTVAVLNALRLPGVEEIRHTGVIQRIQERDGLTTLYWISGLAVARTSSVLRRIAGR